jgi:hypothetical protein
VNFLHESLKKEIKETKTTSWRKVNSLLKTSSWIVSQKEINNI